MRKETPYLLGSQIRIDAHIHFTPPEMAEDLTAFAAQEPYWGLLITPNEANHTAQGWATPERTVADMHQAGIDRVVILGEYRHSHASSRARSDQSLAIMRRWPDQVSAFACIQPKAGQAALDELERCLDQGMLGVGESNPYGQGHTLEDPDFLQIVEACIDHDVPLNLHVSEEIGHYYLGKSTTPLRHYYRLARQYPELKLILAHWGGGLFLYEMMPEVRRDLANVWYDTAASPLLYPTGTIFDVALDCVDHRKLLYGSDYPLLILPKKQKEPDFRPFLQEIEALDLPEEVYRDILGDNMARLLGWLDTGSGEPVAKGRNKPDPTLADPVTGLVPVVAIAQRWPETARVFEKYGIPYEDSPVPDWEPVAQAAAAKGYGPEKQARLLEELNEIIASR